MAKRAEPQRVGARTGQRPAATTRSGERKRPVARDKGAGRATREPKRDTRSGPQTSPTARPKAAPARAKTASQAKARAKARKAKAPKVVRPPLRDRLLARIAEIDFNPRRLIARVPFVVLIIGALGMGLGVTLWLSTSAAERSYELGRARDINQALQQQKEALERDVLEAQSAPALAEAARNLGMIPSRDTAHLVQDVSGNWTVIGSPKPAQGVPPPPLNVPLAAPAPPAPPAPPPPPAPRVVDPRELTVRMPDPAALPPTAALPPAGALPPAAAPQPGLPPQQAAPQGVPLPAPAAPMVPQAGVPQAPAPQVVVPQTLAPDAPIWAPLLAQPAPGAPA